MDHNPEASESELDDDGPEICDARRAGRCQGKILLEYTNARVPFIRCEHRQPGSAGHLLSFNIGEYNIGYLRALLESNIKEVQRIEAAAAARGYGPLVPCRFSVPMNAKRRYCAHWHRNTAGKLVRGELYPTGCTVRFRIYTPYDLHTTPYIGILCTNGPHKHRPPPPSTTPLSIRRIFEGLLREMDWRLANATPGRIQRDEGFIAGLRRVFRTPPWHEPSLLDLHPSFANLDHVASMIEPIKDERYRHGTDFEAAVHLCEEQKLLPENQQYVHVDGVLNVPDEPKPVRIVVCMLMAQSWQLLAATTLQCDTAHKRAKKWLEMELGTWDANRHRAITLARIFLTSLSAQTHCEIFKIIYQLVYKDTKQHMKFRHLHSPSLSLNEWVGCFLLTLDDHKGQALGWGLFFVWLASFLSPDIMDLHETWKRRRDLSPYDHLARILRLCIVHFTRNLMKIESKVPAPIYTRMRRLIGSEEILDYGENIEIIKAQGGTAAINWLNEKTMADNFGVKALYQPKSFIPIEAWKAGQSHTNAKEAKQGDILLEGKNGTLIAAIMIGHRYDRRHLTSVKIMDESGINHYHHLTTNTRRAELSLTRNVRAGKRKVEAADAQVATIQSQITQKQRQVEAQYQAAQASGALLRESPEKKRIRTLQVEIQTLQEEETRQLGKGTGLHAPIAPSNDVPSFLYDGHPQAVSPLCKEDLMHLTKAHLVLLCTSRNLAKSGNKSTLVDRIVAYERSMLAAPVPASSAQHSSSVPTPPNLRTPSRPPSPGRQVNQIRDDPTKLQPVRLQVDGLVDLGSTTPASTTAVSVNPLIRLQQQPPHSSNSINFFNLTHSSRLTLHPHLG